MASVMYRNHNPKVRFVPAPIVVIGNPTFNSSMKGKRPVAPKSIINYLKRFFCVLVIDEYNSSKNCWKCCQPMKKFTESCCRRWVCTGGCMGQRGVKKKKAVDEKEAGPGKRKASSSSTTDSRGKKMPLLVNKDRSAPLAFFYKLLHLVSEGVAPKEFKRPETNSQ